MIKDIHSILLDFIKETLKENLPNLTEEDYPPLSLDVPKDKNHGDLSSNLCHLLSKRIGKPSFEIAQGFRQRIQDKISKSKIKDDIDKIDTIGGFLNIYLSRSYFYNSLKSLLLEKDKFLKCNIGKSKSVNIEFVSANPTGPLSVAHARQAAVGDSLANILKVLGFAVKREYYLNDEGRQIKLLGQSIRVRYKELLGQQEEFPQDGYQGQYIIDLAKEIIQKGAKIENEDLSFFVDFGVKSILAIIQKELEDFGIKFDTWRSQKYIRESGKITKSLSFLTKKKLVYEADGAFWFKSTQFGDDKDRVIIKSDKSYTYLAPDIAYHQDKFKRGFKWLINIWGPDHHGYIPRLKAAVQALGYQKDSISIIIVQLATLYRNKEVIPMSTRSGQYITLRQVLDEVGRDSARFFFLMRRTDSHLDFDLELAKKHSLENPVYYIQYAHARVVNILKNAPPFTYRALLKADLSLLKEEEELQLIKCLSKAKAILLSCYNILDVYPAVVYLQELASLFHRFYDRHRVIGQEKEVMSARLALLEATRKVISSFLNLLGVSAPETM